MARKTIELGKYFSGARREQELSDAEVEIAKLQSEIKELRDTSDVEGSPKVEETKLTQLREHLTERSGIWSIEIDQIHPNSDQPRRTFLSSSEESMCRSLATDGQLEPIILMATGEDRLVIFDGERRWRSAKQLGWKTINAVVIPEPDALHRKALLTSLHREDLNALDKAEAIVLEVSNATGLDEQEITQSLSRVVRRFKQQKRMNQIVDLIPCSPEKQKDGLISLELSGSELAVLTILLDLQLNPSSIEANIFPMLSLKDDLKAAIREHGIAGNQAIALQTLNPKNLGISDIRARSLRIDATKKVVSEGLSVLATRKLVSEIRGKYSQADLRKKEVKQITALAKSLIQLSPEILNSAGSEQLIQLQQTLSQKLEEIELVLKRLSSDESH